MKKKSVYLILLQGLYLVLANAGIKSLAVAEALPLNQAMESRKAEKFNDARTVNKVNPTHIEKTIPRKSMGTWEKRSTARAVYLGS